MDAVAGRFQEGAQESDHRTLAVGPGDMDDGGKLLLRMAQSPKQGLDAPKREIDQFGMKPSKAFEDGFTTQLDGPRMAADWWRRASRRRRAWE